MICPTRDEPARSAVLVDGTLEDERYLTIPGDGAARVGPGGLNNLFASRVDSAIERARAGRRQREEENHEAAFDHDEFLRHDVGRERTKAHRGFGLSVFRRPSG